jgi:hypothetical protein
MSSRFTKPTLRGMVNPSRAHPIYEQMKGNGIDISKLNSLQSDVKFAFENRMISYQEVMQIHKKNMVLRSGELMNLNSSTKYTPLKTGEKCRIYKNRVDAILIDKLLDSE